jgi:hypothetical protein
MWRGRSFNAQVSKKAWHNSTAKTIRDKVRGGLVSREIQPGPRRAYAANKGLWNRVTLDPSDDLYVGFGPGA